MSDLDNSRDVVSLLFQKVAPAFSSRTSGYTRLISLPRRKGDNAKMMRIEWTEKIITEDKKKEEKKDESKKKTVKKIAEKKNSSLKSFNPKS